MNIIDRERYESRNGGYVFVREKLAKDVDSNAQFVIERQESQATKEEVANVLATVNARIASLDSERANLISLKTAVEAVLRVAAPEPVAAEPLEE